MVEMIVEKEIQGAGDLEELLRCYLSLNSAEYHSVIVKEGRSLSQPASELHLLELRRYSAFAQPASQRIAPLGIAAIFSIRHDGSRGRPTNRSILTSDSDPLVEYIRIHAYS
ncbi:hypothetical protein AXG93_2767s1110 [Marchantia polymorpha subsp. ruderalis]|uniref:Transcription repressor n=1 Tax=Marchantia polymorpha subsp. ruderalis TaxID=1480154 RepID=A0A176VUY4_MARPO|nr:hypothetical protein AXG93_2767s1110 [Marchantia polymorpha subsp. ruderalis]